MLFKYINYYTENSNDIKFFLLTQQITDSAYPTTIYPVQFIYEY